MTIQSTQQLPIKIFPQKTTTTHTHTYTDIERETDERTGGRTDQKWNAEQNNRRKQRKKGFCVRLINCFAHVFRAKCSPERINPTTQKPRTSRPIDPPSRGSQTIVRFFSLCPKALIYSSCWCLTWHQPSPCLLLATKRSMLKLGLGLGQDKWMGWRRDRSSWMYVGLIAKLLEWKWTEIQQKLPWFDVRTRCCPR